MENELSLSTAETEEQRLKDNYQIGSNCSEVTETVRRHWCLSDAGCTWDNPVPLRSASVEVRINGFIANVQSTLIYKNTSKDPIEVYYEFPMDDESVVYYFEAQIEDRVIIAECQEKEQAKDTFNFALMEGCRAVLMQEAVSLSDIISCLIGNLPPDGEAVIRFKYVTELSSQPDGALTFLLPVILNPRYKPPTNIPWLFPDNSGQPPRDSDVERLLGKPYSFEIKATVVNPGKIINVKAAKDTLNVKLNDDKTLAEVTLENPFISDHDFTLDVICDGITKPHVIIEKGDNSKDGILKTDVVMLNFYPTLIETDYNEKQECIFIVDQSGSMTGSRNEMAKEALLLFLKSLPPGCYFNIIRFGSDFEVLFPEGSREYSKESLKTALEYQRSMKADLGGTEILQPLQHVYGQPVMETHHRQIFLITDGGVVNIEAVIGLVSKNAKDTRVFSFGIGEGASTALVKGVARASHGRAEFIKENERLQSLVIRSLKAAMQLPLTEVELDWHLTSDSAKIVQLPKNLPTLFAGERIVIYAMTSSDKAALEGKVNLKGKIGDRILNFELDLNAVDNLYSTDESLPIHRLAAKAQIKQLQDSGKDENKSLIVLLSTAANVISCHTSMVGVDKSSREKVDRKVIRGPFQDTIRYGPRYRNRAHACCSLLFGYLIQRIFRMCNEAHCSRCKSEREPEPEPEPEAEETGYASIVSLQSFSGEWELDEEIANVFNTSLEQLKKATPVENLQIWATVLALSYLEVKFPDRRDEWAMIERKARQWLDLQHLEGHTVDDLLQMAKEFLSQP